MSASAMTLDEFIAALRYAAIAAQAQLSLERKTRGARAFEFMSLRVMSFDEPRMEIFALPLASLVSCGEVRIAQLRVEAPVEIGRLSEGESKAHLALRLTRRHFWRRHPSMVIELSGEQLHRVEMSIDGKPLMTEELTRCALTLAS